MWQLQAKLIVRIARVMLPSAVLAACVSPRVVEHYDEGCQIIERHMTLQAHWPGDMTCKTTPHFTSVLVSAGVVGAASAIVSGSIVVVGNVVFWMEKQGQCQRQHQNKTADPANS